MELDINALFESNEDYTLYGLEQFKDIYAVRDIGVECGSYKYHVKNVSPKQHNRQMERDRFLTSLDWRLFRFSGQEIINNPFGCVKQVHNYLLQKSEKVTVPIPYQPYSYRTSIKKK